MPESEADRLADEVMRLWVDFQLALSSDKRKYPVRQFQAFYSAARVMPNQQRRILWFMRVWLERFMELSTSSAWNANGFQTASFGMLKGWSAFCSAGTTRTSKAMNRQNYEASQIEQSRSPISWM